MKCPNCNKQAVFTETINYRGDYYLECPHCGIHFINTTSTIQEPDFQYIRTHAAIMAMRGLLSARCSAGGSGRLYYREAGNYVINEEEAAKYAIKYADALINKLK
jgi:hypothetical protein